MNIKILDCTIRDGGYYNEWDFSQSLINSYLEAVERLPVDYFEIGYRSILQSSYHGKYFYSPVFELERIQSITSKKMVIMINLKDTRESDLESLLGLCKRLITMVRIAFDPTQLQKAISLALTIKSMGFEVGFNMMYMTNWKNDSKVYKQLQEANGVVDYIYMVDSYGGVFPKDIAETMSILKQNTNIPIGFHGHNNLELALVNTLTAIEHGAILIDSTFTGMGRGAGNLKTELLLTVLNHQKNLDVDFNVLGAVVYQFSELQKKYGWGTSLPYMFSGVNSLPQKDVMEWVTKRYYSFNSIIRTLQNKKNAIADNQQLQTFSPQQQFRKAVIVGGGPNASLHASSVLEYLGLRKDICLIHASSKNAGFYHSAFQSAFFCLVGNEGHRLENVFNQELNDFIGQCILPPYPRKMGTYVPTAVKNRSYELPDIIFTKLINDSHTVLALQTAIQLGAIEVELVGYDGYQEGVISQIEKSLYDENDLIFADFKKYTGIQLKSLTNTNYKNLLIEPVFSKIQ